MNSIETVILDDMDIASGYVAVLAQIWPGARIAQITMVKPNMRDEPVTARFDLDKQNFIDTIPFSQGPHANQRLAMRIRRAGTVSAPAEVAAGLEWVLGRIGNLTEDIRSAPWDQLLRAEYGDEKTYAIISWLASRGITPHRGQ